MASEEHVDVSIRLPPDLGEWLTEQAAEMNRNREDVVRELVAAYQSMASGDDVEDVLTADDVDEFVDEDALEAYVQQATFEDALDEHRGEFEALLDDVRKRVVQVKREADAKAPADHEHDALEERVDALAADVTSTSEAVAAVEDDMQAGFENFEDVLEYLTETTDELEEKTGALARVLVDIQSEVKRLRADESRRAEAEALQLAANREGVRTAKCGECESSVDVSLLSAPECPHCASTFSDVEKRSGLFSSSRLVTGDPPALPGGQDDDLNEELAEELVEEAEDVPE
jgi:chromosome segregation ATPase